MNNYLMNFPIKSKVAPKTAKINANKNGPKNNRNVAISNNLITAIVYND